MIAQVLRLESEPYSGKLTTCYSWAMKVSHILFARIQEPPQFRAGPHSPLICIPSIGKEAAAVR
jgi:hypothetical protein